MIAGIYFVFVVVVVVIVAVRYIFVGIIPRPPPPIFRSGERAFIVYTPSARGLLAFLSRCTVLALVEAAARSSFVTI